MLGRIAAMLVFAFVAWPAAGQAQNVGPLYGPNSSAAPAPGAQSDATRDERYQRQMQRTRERAYLDGELTPAEALELRRSGEKFRRGAQDADGTASGAQAVRPRSPPPIAFGERSRDYTGTRDSTNTPAWALPPNRRLQ